VPPASSGPSTHSTPPSTTSPTLPYEPNQPPHHDGEHSGAGTADD
jgi:hypothetical protein